jgi:FdhD protein
MMPIPLSAIAANAITWRSGVSIGTIRALPEEVAVALTYDHVTFAVMMASPIDLEDFAIGFSLSERIIHSVKDIIDIQIIASAEGIECRLTLVPQMRAALEDRRRRIMGPVGCGLCGLDNLKEANRPPAEVTSAFQITAATVMAAISQLSQLQTLNNETRAAHAAGFFTNSTHDILIREDVGRHNALDKVIGAVTRRGDDPAAGAILVTSRVSLDLIQKTASFGASVLVAISVPTARAVREADTAGITLIAVARNDGFEIFTRAERVISR